MRPEGEPEEDAGKESFSSAKMGAHDCFLGTVEGCDNHLMTMRNLKLKGNTTKRVTQWVETSTDL